ncbi:MAG: response regulator [Proteobacteria bacterium]|nr:response regulator [Pseudomonadota bacterium]
MIQTALIIDDSKLARSVIRQYLETEGFTTIDEAENGLDGYKKYQEMKPGLLVTDIEMPKINGLKLLEKIRETDSELKVIVMTAVANSHAIKQLKKLDAQFLKKPMNDVTFSYALKVSLKQ